MGRPTKPISLQKGAITEENTLKRQDGEKEIGGENDKIDIPTMKKLTANQKKIRKEIVALTKQYIYNADRYVLDHFCIVIDRLQNMEIMTNKEPELLTDKTFQSTRKNYFSEFARLCNELALSPQARAKLANGTSLTGGQGTNPVNKIFGDDDD